MVASVLPDGHSQACHCKPCWAATNASNGLVEALDPVLPDLLALSKRALELESQLLLLAKEGMLDLPFDGARMTSDSEDEQLAIVLVGIETLARELGWPGLQSEGGKEQDG